MIQPVTPEPMKPGIPLKPRKPGTHTKPETPLKPGTVPDLPETPLVNPDHDPDLPEHPGPPLSDPDSPHG